MSNESSERQHCHNDLVRALRGRKGNDIDITVVGGCIFRGKLISAENGLAFLSTLSTGVLEIFVPGMAVPLTTAGSVAVNLEVLTAIGSPRI